MTDQHRERTPFLRSPIGIALCVFLAVAVLLLLLEHGAHVLGAWPLLLLLLCIGAHFFMHRGHGHGGSHEGGGGPRDER
jgi:hypothetical protein